VDTFENVHKRLVTCGDISHSLGVGLQICHKELGEILTPRRTAIPVKIVFAGENGCKRDVGEES
jgi:hypothetical protein